METLLLFVGHKTEQGGSGVMSRANWQKKAGATDAHQAPGTSSRHDVGVAEIVTVRVFLKSHGFSYPKISVEWDILSATYEKKRAGIH
jgi:hypothetical protein